MSNRSATPVRLEPPRSVDREERERLIREMHRQVQEAEDRIKRAERLSAADLSVRVNLTT